MLPDSSVADTLVVAVLSDLRMHCQGEVGVMSVLQTQVVHQQVLLVQSQVLHQVLTAAAAAAVAAVVLTVA
jgi:MFS superfamily sulfate permease-like transporter